MNGDTWIYGKFLNGETYQMFDGTICMWISGTEISVVAQPGIQEVSGSILPKLNFYDRRNFRVSILRHLKKAIQNAKGIEYTTIAEYKHGPKS